MDFGDVIKRAWAITWRYKALWVLGIFAGVSGCQGGSSPGGSSRWSEDAGSTPTGLADFERFLASMGEWLPALIALSIGLFLLWIVLSVIGVAARGGLITAANAADEGRPLSLGEAWSSGFARFWSLLGLELLVGVPVFLLAVGLGLMIVLPVVSAMRDSVEPGLETVAPVCGALLVLAPLLLIVSLLLGVLYLIAGRYLMLGGQGALESLKSAWGFFRARMKDTVLMYLINGLMNAAVGMVIGIVVVLIGAGISIPAIVALRSQDQGIEAMIAPVAVALVVAGLVLAVFNAVWGTFTSSLWTVFFRHATGMIPPAARPVPAQAAWQTPQPGGTYPPAPPAASTYPPAPPGPPVAEEPPAPWPPAEGPPA